MVSGGRRFFTVLLIIVMAIALTLVGYLAYRYLSDYILQKEASEAVDEFENMIITVAIDEEETNTVEVNNTSTIPETPSTTGSTQKKSRVTYKSFNVIGTIQIPRTGVKYPIVSDTTPAAMDSAIVMLYGPGLNQVGNTVIAGHNYRNGGFFGGNKKLSEGDKIFITDLSGTKIEYTVYRKYETSDADFSYATRNTDGKREISLSTCTNNSEKRLIIWAKES